MSNYTPVNDFSVKDGLVSGDPEKLILGSDMDAETAAIQTAVNTKLSTAGVGLTSSSETVNLDISTLTGESAIADADVLAFYDATAAAMRKVTYAQLITAQEASLNHDSLTGFVANEHIDMSGVTLTLATGLTYSTGGTDLTADATIALALNDISIVSPGITDFWIHTNNGTGVEGRATLGTLNSLLNVTNLDGFVNDQNVAHAGVTITAGVGLSGGGTIAATRTIDLDINGLATATLNDDDSLAFYDAGAAVEKKLTGAALKTYIGAGVTEFLSSGQTFGGGSDALNAARVDTAHSLGAQPDMTFSYVECTAANHGYSIGDRVYAGAWQSTPDADEGWTYGSDTTNVYVEVLGLKLIPIGGGSPAFITRASWKLYVQGMLF